MPWNLVDPLNDARLEDPITGKRRIFYLPLVSIPLGLEAVETGNSLNQIENTSSNASDDIIKPYKKYYYALRTENPNRIYSRTAKAAVGFAYDYSSPEEPIWQRAGWVKLDFNDDEHPWSDDIAPDQILAILLDVSLTKSNVSAMIKPKEADREFISLSQWLGHPIFDEVDNAWKYRYYDTTADSSNEYTYRLKLMSKVSLLLIQYKNELFQFLMEDHKWLRSGTWSTC